VHVILDHLLRAPEVARPARPEHPAERRPAKCNHALGLLGWRLVGGQRQGARVGVDLTDLAASGEKLDDPHHAIHHKKKGDRHQDAERQAFCQSHLPIHGGTRGELDAA
jgi:hypothetical protein